MQRREFLFLSQAGLILSAVPTAARAFDFLQHQDSEEAMRVLQDEFCADALVDASILEPREDDIIATPQEYQILVKLHKHLSRVQKTIGYGHFNTLNFDDMVKTGRWYSKVGGFTRAELDYFEQVFYESAQTYGFYGQKVIADMTNVISKREIKKVPHTGHYLFQGDSWDMYYKIKKEMDNKIILTSGVRNIVKQMYLFLNKTVRTKGNISIASRSLAPAGYSYHGISDFDIGKVGFGRRNFTSAFAKTEEFKKLTKLGYLKIRYPKNNPFGVRYEPWHVKVYDV